MKTVCGVLNGLALGCVLLGAHTTAGPTELLTVTNTQSQAEPLAIITHKKTNVENLTLEDLRKIYLGQRSHWGDGRKIHLVMCEPGNVERETMLRQILQISESEYRRFQIQSAYTAETSAKPRELTPGVRVVRFVFNVPGSIGYVRASQVDGSVKVVAVEGRTPDQPDYPIKLASQ
jgi:ABC-type phosphate transport system substrate-binding protein